MKVKHAVKKYVFGKLKKLQEGHNKMSAFCYKTFETQRYLTNHTLNNHEISLLFSLRSRTARAFKANFPYYAEQLWPLGCPDIDSQEHITLCEKVYIVEKRTSSIEYNDIFSDDLGKGAKKFRM